MYTFRQARKKKGVNGERNLAAHAEDGGKQIRAGAQIGDLAQKLERVALFLQGIVGSGRTLDLNGLSLDLKGLLSLGSKHERSPIPASFCT